MILQVIDSQKQKVDYRAAQTHSRATLFTKWK